MFIFIECWKARPEWLSLTHDERSEYLNRLSSGINELAKTGAEIVTWSLNDTDTPHRIDYDYFAIWRFPTKELVVQFEQIIEQSGWYNYFEQ
ncbi:MAG: hypothetical protein Q8862_11375, partial [Bacteroidota bacterium]|nr:hypothetical protein [Bacteroidota bacterium]